MRKRVADYTGEEFDRVVSLNLRSAFDLVRSFGAGMAERGRGSIVGFSLHPRGRRWSRDRACTPRPRPGLVQLLRTAAAELGAVGGAGQRGRARDRGDPADRRRSPPIPDWYQAYADKSALGGGRVADELAGAVVYLASDASTFVTGSHLFVDGGWTAVDGRYTPPA